MNKHVNIVSNFSSLKAYCVFRFLEETFITFVFVKDKGQFLLATFTQLQCTHCEVFSVEHENKQKLQ